MNANVPRRLCGYADGMDHNRSYCDLLVGHLGDHRMVAAASFNVRPAESDASLYIVGNWETGNAMLECHRSECKVPGHCPGGLCFWTEDLPHQATLRQVAEAHARHLATHDPVELGRTYRSGESFTVSFPPQIIHPVEP